MLIGLTAILALSGLLFLLPQGRAVLRKRVLPILRSGSGMAEVARRPLKLVELFGGSAVLTLAYVAAFAFSIDAFGGGLSLATIGVVYLSAPPSARRRRPRAASAPWRRRSSPA